MASPEIAAKALQAITEFLTARYDEDEAIARRAMHSNGYWTHEFEFGQETRVRLDFGPDVAHGRGTLEASNHAHIALHDPARVLADIAAKRAIAGMHTAEGAECAQCSFRELYEGFNDVSEPWPCPTLRLLAQPYADHPDFDPAWRA